MKAFELKEGPFKKIIFRRPCCGADEGLSGEPRKGRAAACLLQGLVGIYVG